MTDACRVVTGVRRRSSSHSECRPNRASADDRRHRTRTDRF